MLLATLEDGSSGALSLPQQLTASTALAGLLLVSLAAGAGCAGGESCILVLNPAFSHKAWIVFCLNHSTVT